MKEPIFIVDGNAVAIYSTRAGAELGLEPLYVEYSDFKAYDCIGNLLNIMVSETEGVLITDSNKTAIQKFPLYIGKDKKSIEAMSLQQLIDSLIDI